MRTLRVLYRLSLLLFAMLAGSLQRLIEFTPRLNPEAIEIDSVRQSRQQ